MRYFYVVLLLAVTSLCSWAKNARTIHLNDRKTENIFVTPGKSVILNFPSRPTKVILGNKGLFAVEYVEQDLALNALKYPAHSNAFVYLEGRRFGFNLTTVSDGGDEIVLVRDTVEQKIKVKIKND